LKLPMTDCRTRSAIRTSLRCPTLDRPHRPPSPSPFGSTPHEKIRLIQGILNPSGNVSTHRSLVYHSPILDFGFATRIPNQGLRMPPRKFRPCFWEVGASTYGGQSSSFGTKRTATAGRNWALGSGTKDRWRSIQRPTRLIPAQRDRIKA
jgi:hypothetical protein